MAAPVSQMSHNASKTKDNYNNLLNGYHPALEQLNSAFRQYETAGAQMIEAQNEIAKSLAVLLKHAEDSSARSDLPDGISAAEEIIRKLKAELEQYQEAAQANIVELDLKISKDGEYLNSELQKLRKKWNDGVDAKEAKEKEISKLAKKGKSKKDDQKRMQKEQELKQITKNLDNYARESLKKSVLEQNKRYGFAVESLKKSMTKLSLFHAQNQKIIAEHLDELNLGNTDWQAAADAAVEETAPTPRKSIYQMPDMSEDIHNMSEPSIPPAPVVAASTAATVTRAVSPSGNSPDNSPAPSKKRVKATHPYAGDGQTKLQLDVGDTVQLLIPQPRDGWHYGENEKSGLRGWFPIQYTTKLM
ncbi:Oidioi.mRNA.OKI2018_I69.chr2.g4503.t2.cds [Oikopleura dioica]|uniref:Oidioi.mRNA.OKI2018_I69.chr2.g4503.t2.cds n=1 Tax=Oikopleura dioica TaxID=34765 RepID=A0ABN7T345_OIKDI|nr:Oidioi.mRNA.OKI2018_I69.chr2.g4503.t2.cds [Oikopleura dioica]